MTHELLYDDPFEGRSEFRVIQFTPPPCCPPPRCPLPWLCGGCRLPLETDKDYRRGMCPEWFSDFQEWQGDF